MSSLQKRAEAAADPDTVAAEPPRLTHPEIRFVFYGLMLGGFLQALNQTIVASALPTIGRDLNDFQNLSWVVIAYLLVVDHRRAALRQARRHPRPPRHDDDGARPVHRRLGAVRGGARHGDADRRPHAAGHRRRRHRADGADHRRRHGDAARARPLPGLYGHRLDHRRHGRSRARRHHRAELALVADLLAQRAARLAHRRAAQSVDEAAAAGGTPPQARFPRRGAGDGGGDALSAGAHHRRHPRAVALADDLRADRRLDPAHCRGRMVAQARARAVPAAQRARQSGDEARHRGDELRDGA